jgi:hypothetical protein
MALLGEKKVSTVATGMDLMPSGERSAKGIARGDLSFSLVLWFSSSNADSYGGGHEHG